MCTVHILFFESHSSCDLGADLNISTLHMDIMKAEALSSAHIIFNLLCHLSSTH